MHKNNGITLIETIVYLGIFSLFIASFFPWFIDLYRWRGGLEVNSQQISKYLFIEGILADISRNSQDISETALGDNFTSVSFSLDRLENFSIYRFNIHPNGLNLGTTSYPTMYE